METKILLNEGKDQALAFQQAVQNVMTRSNELIDAWHKWQDFDQVETYDDFLTLINDPVARMDQLLISSVDINIAGGKTKIVPAALAPMLGIDYESWLNLVAGKPIKLDCEPCRKTKIRKGQSVISLQEFKQYEKYLAFQNSRFVVADQAVKEKQETFAVYTTSEQQNELHEFWENACNTLNQLHTKGYFGNTAFINLQKELQNRLMYSYGDNQLHVNESLLTNEVLKIQ